MARAGAGGVAEEHLGLAMSPHNGRPGKPGSRAPRPPSSAIPPSRETARIEKYSGTTTRVRYFRLGYASAIGVTMLVVTVVVIYVQCRVARRWRLL